MAIAEFTTEEINNEIWKPVVGYEGIYSVSNIGRVRRDSAQDPKWIGHIMTQTIRFGGYMGVHLYRPGHIQVTHFVHRLVAFAFLGKPPEGRSQVNHINGKKTDNRVENLEWVSPPENALHSIHVINSGGRDSRNGFAKLHETDVIQIKKMLLAGSTCASIARQFNVTATTIQYIRQGKYWQHVKVEGLDS